MKLTFKTELSYSDKKKELKLPENMTEELAELLGVLSGDGCISYYPKKNEYWVSITGNSLSDMKYFIHHLAPLLKRIFNIDSKILKVKNQHTIRIVIRSKGLFYFLKSIGMNIGPKNNIDIPKIVLAKRELIIAFIRGLFDTDGSLSLKGKRRYPVISIKQKSRKIIEQLESILKSFGFPMYVEYDVVTHDARGFTSKGHRIYIYGRKNLEKWIMLIGFNNHKNLERVEKVMGQMGFEPMTAKP